MSTKVCSSCSGTLHFNRKSGFFVCDFCGKVYVHENEETPLSLGSVDQLMLQHKFTEAKERLKYLTEVEPDIDLFTLRSFLCDFHFNNTAHLLNSLNNDPKKAEEVKTWPYWEIFRKELPDDNKAFVDLILEYCDLCSELGKLRTEFGADTKAPVFTPELGEYEKIVPKNNNILSTVIIVLVTMLGIAIPGAAIANAHAPRREVIKYLEDGSQKIIPASSPLAKKDSTIPNAIIFGSIAFAIVASVAYPFIRTAIIRRTIKSGKIYEREDGVLIKKTKKPQNHKPVEKTREQELYLKIQETEKKLSEILIEVQKREAII